MTKAGGRSRWSRGFIVAGLMMSPIATSQQALVHSTGQTGLEIGQAWLLSAAGRCYAVLPAHVARESGDTVLLLREGRGSERGELDEVIDLGEDIAIGVVHGSAGRACGPTMGSIGRAVDRQLAAGGGSALRAINGDGTVARSNVLVVDDDGGQWLHVSPSRDQDRIRKGQSGSLLYVADMPVGMLMSVNAASGVGRVVRVDALMRKVEGAVRADVSQPATVHADTRPPHVWEVVAWNVDPAPEGATARSLAFPEQGRFWRAAFTQSPISIDVRSPSGIQTVTEIELDARGVDAHELPARVQVLARVGTGGWRAVTTIAPVFVDGVAGIRFAPTRAESVRLEFYGTHNEKATVGLRGIAVH